MAYDEASRKANANKLGEVIVKSWTDDDFKQRLLADPATVLQEHGVQVPPGVGVKVLEDTNDVNYLVLPAKPTDMEVSDFQADDASWCWSYNVVGCF
jgi:hypothetical protein